MYELKKNIDQRFEAQSEMIKSVVHGVFQYKRDSLGGQ